MKRLLESRMGKVVLKLIPFLLTAKIASAELNMDRIKQGSLDLASLINSVLIGENPKTDGKIDQDKYGYFVRCGMPNDAIEIIAEASNEKIIPINKEKYVFVPIEGTAEGICARLDGEKLYIDKLSDLEAVKKALIPEPEVKKVYQPKPEVKKPEVKYKPKAKPKSKIEKVKEIKENYIKPKLGENISEEKIEKLLNNNESAIDWNAALGKIFEKNHELSYLLHSKISNEDISKEDLSDYPSLEEIFAVKDGEVVSAGYSLRSSSPSVDINLIKEAFKVYGDSDTIKIDNKLSLRFYNAQDNMIEIERIEK